MCVLMSVSLSSESRERSLKSAFEPYQAVGNEEKIIYLLCFRKKKFEIQDEKFNINFFSKLLLLMSVLVI